MIDYSGIIRTIREDSNLSRKELAEKCNVSEKAGKNEK